MDFKANWRQTAKLLRLQAFFNFKAPANTITKNKILKCMGNFSWLLLFWIHSSFLFLPSFVDKWFYSFFLFLFFSSFILSGNSHSCFSTSWRRRWRGKENFRCWSTRKCECYLWVACLPWLAHWWSGIKIWSPFGWKWLLWSSNKWKGGSCSHSSALNRSNIGSF